MASPAWTTKVSLGLNSIIVRRRGEVVAFEDRGLMFATTINGKIRPDVLRHVDIESWAIRITLRRQAVSKDVKM